MCYSAWNTQPQPHNGISSPSIILLLTPTSSEVTKTRLYSRKSVPTFFIHWYLSHTYTMQFRNVRVLADCSNLAGDLNRLSSRKIFTKLGRPIKSANRPKDRRREREREKNEKGRMTYHAYCDNALPIDRSFYASSSVKPDVEWSHNQIRSAYPSFLNVSQNFSE